jgi:hypothetical protein
VVLISSGKVAPDEDSTSDFSSFCRYKLGRVSNACEMGLTKLWFAELNLTADCNLAGRAYAKYILDEHQRPLAELVALIRSIAPSMTANITDGEIVDWYYASEEKSMGLKEAWDSLPAGSSSACEKAFCSSQQFKGNLELAGIGVRAVSRLMI